VTKKPKPDIRMITRLVPPSGNLVQGQSEVAMHPALVRALSDVVNEGLNHYSLFEGVPELRKAVAEKIARFNNVEVDITRKPYELIITPGATGALVAIAHTYLTNASMILFEPYYPYHKKILETCNAQADLIELKGEELSLDIEELRRRCKEGKDRKDHPLKAILVCSPTNPTGKVFTKEELIAIADCCKEFDLLCISDEVYEHFVLSEKDHISIATLPDMKARTITCNSFSKSWAVSGWRLGYTFGAGELVGPLHNVGNIFYVCTPTPLQHALSRVLMTDEHYYVNLRSLYKIKRDILANALTKVGFTLYDSRSTFYMWARIPEKFEDSETLNNFLMEKGKVAGVPGTAFADGTIGEKYMRFCFAREEDMLTRAAEQIVNSLSK
jgi:aminotransferase